MFNDVKILFPRTICISKRDKNSWIACVNNKIEGFLEFALE